MPFLSLWYDLIQVYRQRCERSKHYTTVLVSVLLNTVKYFRCKPTFVSLRVKQLNCSFAQSCVATVKLHFLFVSSANAPAYYVENNTTLCLCS